ncbi:MAG TPA: NAD(P)/FAD-dependent oxidoreductase [Parafilimonas sp.]
MKTQFDAVVVGSGPNGLAAAITLQQQGLSVLLIEGKDTIGGGLRSAELTLPGFMHDVCSAVHPMAADSSVFKKFPLEKFGLEFLYSPFSAAHPFDDGSAVVLQTCVERTAQQFQHSEEYKQLINPLLNNWINIRSAFLGPLHISKQPIKTTSFAYHAIVSASHLARNNFTDAKAQALFAGMAAHSMLPLNKLTTSAIALVLMLIAHYKGWPLIKGGSQKLADALASYFISLGGKIETNNMVASVIQLPLSKVILFDVSPKQLLKIAGEEFSSFHKWQLQRYKYGMGVFKIDWALSQPAPFRALQCRQATTAHLGNSFKEIIQSEQAVWNGKHSPNPFVIFVQPTIIDTSRAPSEKYTAWAYCHVPNGSTHSMNNVIENQVERFAPGFRDCILARHTMNTLDLENYNPNYIGGDINGGVFNLTQFFTRPALRLSPYRTSAKNIYICSASTPPGGGVHGICGYYAARRALKDVFKIQLPVL